MSKTEYEIRMSWADNDLTLMTSEMDTHFCNKTQSNRIGQCCDCHCGPASSFNSDLLFGRILPCKTATKVGEEMTWPSYDQGDLEWQLRYGTEDQVIRSRMTTASIVEAYRALIDLPQKRRNEICRAIREAK